MTLVFLLIRARHGQEGIVKTALSKFEEISECYEVFGRYDIFAKVETRGTKEFAKFIKNKLRIIEGIKSIEPVFAAEDSFNDDSNSN